MVVTSLRVVHDGHDASALRMSTVPKEYSDGMKEKNGHRKRMRYSQT